MWLDLPCIYRRLSVQLLSRYLNQRNQAIFLSLLLDCYQKKMQLVVVINDETDVPVMKVIIIFYPL